MDRQYRDKGAVGALMDEYERAAEELKSVLQTVAIRDYVKILDLQTDDPDCRSMQTIMNHVVRSGYGYANYIRKQFGDSWADIYPTYPVETPQNACDELDKMLAYTLETIDNKWDITFEEILENIIRVRWGQTYDFEQLFEHAIVHILRHRRQIERFILKLN